MRSLKRLHFFSEPSIETCPARYVYTWTFKGCPGWRSLIVGWGFQPGDPDMKVLPTYDEPCDLLGPVDPPCMFGLSSSSVTGALKREAQTGKKHRSGSSQFGWLIKLPDCLLSKKSLFFFFFFWCLYLTSYGPVRWRRFDSAGPVVFQHSYAPLELRVRSPRLCVRSRAPLRPALRPAPRETRGSAGFRASEASEARANDVKCAVISPWMVSAGTWNEWAFQYHHRCEALAPGHRSEAYFDFVRVRPAEAGSEDLRRPRQWVRPTA